MSAFRSSALIESQFSSMQSKALSIVDDLLGAWHQSGVCYCHWKSNCDLERGLSGKGDLDILVSRDDAIEATNSLMRLGFKRLVEAPGKGYPGIEHWIGYSEPEGLIAHLHIHYRLVFGEKFVKSYRFPCESEILSRRFFERGVYQINRADELVMLFIRTILKTDLIWIVRKLLGLKKHYFPTHIILEYKFLLAQTTDEEVAEAATRFFPAEADDVIEALRFIDRLSVAALLSWKARIRKRLSWSRRIPWWRSSILATTAYCHLLLGKLGVRRKPRKKIYTGGVKLALLGADGAGKSTMVRELEAWLSPQLEVVVLYGGSGDGTKSLAFQGFEYMKRLLLKKSEVRNFRQVGARSSGNRGRVRLLGRVARAVVIALHRRRVAKAGNLHSNEGAVVIYDRFPQPFQRGYADGPKIEPTDGVVGGWLRKWELQTYERIYKFFPDHCFVLKVDPRVSVERKEENTVDEIERKNAVLDQIISDWPERCSAIDANQDYDVVLRQLKQKVWMCL